MYVNTSSRSNSVVGDIDCEVNTGLSDHTGCTHKIRIAVFGHSWCNYIGKSQQGITYNYMKQQTVGEFEIKYIGVPGGKVGTIQNTRCWDNLIEYRPHMTYVILGGNDISPNTDCKVLAHALHELGTAVKERTTSDYMICSIEDRPNPRRLDHAVYKNKKNKTNRHLKYINKHRYLLLPVVGYKEDGVHPNTEATHIVHERFVNFTRRWLERSEHTLELQLPTWAS